MQTAKLLDINDSIERLKELQRVVTGVAAAAESWIECLPFPAWVKNQKGENIFCNQFYADHYGVDRTGYEGEKDRAVWGLQVEATFSLLDNRVNETRQVCTGWEALGEGRKVFVVKFPVYDGADYIGPGGIVLFDDGKAGIPRVTAACNQHPSG